MPFQLTSNGLEIQTQEEIADEIKTDLQSVFGPNTNVGPTSFFGQLANIIAELRAADQQVALALYNSFDPNGASGVSLDQRAALTASIRRGETFSTVEGLVNTSGAVNIPNGSLIELDSDGSQWELISGPIVEAVGGAYAATFQAVTAGPISASAGSTWNLITTVANWDSFTNPVEDATPGQLEESDGSFRIRRNIELFSEDRGSLNGIAAVVSELNTENGFVERVRVYHNPTESPTDSNGIPFKAFNVVVRTNPPIDPMNLPPTSALQQDVADTIIRVLGAGGEAYGTDVVLTSVDVEGQNQPIAYDVFRDADVYLYISIQTANFVAPFDNQPVVPLNPSQMADVVRNYVVERANEDLTGIGQDILSFELEGYIKELSDAQTIRGINLATIGSNITGALDPFLEITEVGIRFIPDYDTGRVIVNVDGVDY